MATVFSMEWVLFQCQGWLRWEKFLEMPRGVLIIIMMMNSDGYIEVLQRKLIPEISIS